MTRRFPVDSYELSARLLVNAMRLAIEQGLEWPPRPSTDSALRFGRPGDQVSAEPGRFWDHFGEVVTLRDNRRCRGIQVRVAEFSSVRRVVDDLYTRIGKGSYNEFRSQLRELATPADFPERTIAEVIAFHRRSSPIPDGYRDLSQDAIADLSGRDPNSRADPILDDWIRCFDRLPPAVQEPMVPRLRSAMALGILRVRIAEREADLLPTQYEVNRERPPEDQERAARMMDQAGRDLILAPMTFVAVVKNFLDAYCWEQSVLPSERVERILPPGFWPLIERIASTDVPQLELSEREVTRDDPRVDPTRFDFYTRELGCRCVVEPEGWFGDRNYVAFLLKAASGARFALLDCIERDNAVYVLRVGHPDTGDASEWAAEARRTKWELICSQGTGRPFVRRFYHSLHWRDRIRSFLENQ